MLEIVEVVKSLFVVDIVGARAKLAALGAKHVELEREFRAARNAHPSVTDPFAEAMRAVERETGVWDGRLRALTQRAVTPPPPDPREVEQLDVVARVEAEVQAAEDRLAERMNERERIEEAAETLLSEGRPADRSALGEARRQEEAAASDLRTTNGALLRARTKLVDIRKAIRVEQEETARAEARALLATIEEHALLAAAANERLGELASRFTLFPEPLHRLTREGVRHFVAYAREHLRDPEPPAAA